jgi:hypothetical protein
MVKKKAPIIHVNAYNEGTDAYSVVCPAFTHSRLFRNSDPETYILLMYRNTKSVIIGRNQAS